MRKLILIGLLSVFLFSVNAQSADEVSAILVTSEVTYEQAEYFAASWLGLVTESTTKEQAVEILKEKGIFETNVDTKLPITYSDFCLLCLRTWDLKGGLLYRITGSARYAYRELQAKSFLPSFVYPSSKVNGQNAMSIMYDCAEFAESKIKKPNNDSEIKGEIK